MRTYLRDWIAWTLLAAVLVVATSEYYIRQQTGLGSGEYVYKFVVTPDRTNR